MVTFTPVQRESLAGRPRIPIPEPIKAWLEKTYAANEMCVLPIDEDDIPEFLRLCTLYAKRKGLTIQSVIGPTTDDGKVELQFRMKAKRSYQFRRTEKS